MSDAAPTPTPLPAAQTTFAVYSGPPLDSIKTMVALEFQVKDAFLDPYGIPTVQASLEPAKQKFQRLLDQLRQQGLIAAIRGTTDSLTIKVFRSPKLSRLARLSTWGSSSRLLSQSSSLDTTFGPRVCSVVKSCNNSLSRLLILRRIRTLRRGCSLGVFSR